MRPEQPVPDPRLVDLFAGPGGLDVAATWLGLPSVGIEWDDDACLTRRAAGLRTVQADVRSLGPSDFPGATILTAGPPCQTFTMAGTGNGRRDLAKLLAMIDRLGDGQDVSGTLAELDDERTGLVLEPLRWVLDAERSGQPYEAIVLEQVPAVRPIWIGVASVLRRHGYRTDEGVVRTEQFGVPQTRRRALLLAHRNHQPRMPLPTHRAYRKGVPREEGDPELLPWEPMGEALSRDGEFTAVSNYGTNGDPTARGRRRSDEPAATITGKIRRTRLLGSCDTDPEQRLSFAEAGRLQTFPTTFPWSGKDHGQQIGNAMPPRLAAHALAAVLRLDLPSSILDHWIGKRWAPAVEEPGLSRLPPQPQEESHHHSSTPTLFAL